MKNRNVYYFLIFLLFLGSVILRAPNLNRPLSDHHEWVTAHTMIILENWTAQGALKNKLCLLTTYPTFTDKFIWTSYGRIMNNAGNGYYISFPSFAAIFPYMIFKALSVPCTVLNVQILNLVMHLITTYFVFLIFCFVMKDHKNCLFAAFLASAYFIYLPANLWFFSNIYSWDILWHYFWVIGIYQVLKIVHDMPLKHVTSSSLILLGVNIFLITYTLELSGIFFAVSIIAYGTAKLCQYARYKHLMFYAVCPVIFALMVTYAQYAAITNTAEVIHYFQLAKSEYKFRGLMDILKIIHHYKMAYSGILVPIIIVLLISLKKWGVKYFHILNQNERVLLFFCFFPVMLQHLLQPNHTGEHDYQVLRSSMIFISVLILGFNHLASSGRMGRLLKSFLLILFAISIIFPITTYQNYYAFSSGPQRFLKLSQKIRKASGADDVIFLISEIDNEPPLVFHTKRNMLSVIYPEEAKEWLNQYGREQGIIMHIDKNFNITQIEKVLSDVSGQIKI